MTTRQLDPLSVIARTEIGQLTTLQLRLLAAVASFPRGRVDTTELLAALAVSPAGLSRAADHLVNQGYLIRRDHDDDRRKTVLAVTPMGVDTIRRFALALAQSTRARRLQRRMPVVSP